MPSTQETSKPEAEQLLYNIRDIKNSLLIKARRDIDDDEVLKNIDELLTDKSIYQESFKDIRHEIINELMICCTRLAYPYAKSLCSNMLIVAWGDEKEIKEIKRFRDELMLKRGRLLELMIPENSWVYALEARLGNIKLPRFLRNTFLSRIKISSNPNTLDLVTTLSYLSFVVIIVVITYNVNHWNDKPPVLVKLHGYNHDVAVYDSKVNITYHYDQSKYDSILKSLDSFKNGLTIIKRPSDSIEIIDPIQLKIDSVANRYSR